ncbi:MAG: nedA [Phycisphaerales bacterium]|nr:nedA [Phycisphaerales bacterium]
MNMRMLVGLGLCLFATAVGAAEPIKTDLFQADTNGYQTYRIPGVVVTKKGTIIVYCEARKSAKSDWGTIDVMMRRSIDGGVTFDAPRRMEKAPDATGVTINNPLAIADSSTGAVHFLYCVDYARCFYTRSDDDGVTYSKPVDITLAFEELRPKYDWKVIATGPGHGIRLKTGRLLVPVWLALRHEHRPSCVATIYSDDDGRTWHAGAIVVDTTKETPNPSETAAVELTDGRVMLNIRNESPRHRRLISISKEGIGGWSEPAFDDALFDPICMASLVRAGDCLVFVNPAGDGKGKARTNLTVRISADDGKTWAAPTLLEPGIAAYSDLATAPDGTVFCFYECGGVKDQQFYTRSLRLAKLAIPPNPGAK